jgi:hypothetical protein
VESHLTPPTLNYSTTPRLRFPWRSLSTLAAVSAALCWYYADWWVYYINGDLMVPDYELPLLFQINLSILFGVLLACAVWFIWSTIRRALAPKSPETPPDALPTPREI